LVIKKYYYRGIYRRNEADKFIFLLPTDLPKEKNYRRKIHRRRISIGDAVDKLITDGKIPSVKLLNLVVFKKIKVEGVTFDNTPNVSTNPLKKHAIGNEVVNLITNDSESGKKWAVLKVSMSKLFDILAKVNNLKWAFNDASRDEPREYCKFHCYSGYYINYSEEFNYEVKTMLTLGKFWVEDIKIYI
jgi:hypothetical protein